MKTPVSILAKNDFKLILRDSTLVLALFGPIGIMTLLFFLPSIERLVLEKLAFDLTSYRLFITGFLSLVPGMLFGMIYGFIILDERDENIIQSISVTPLRTQGYLSYKLQMPMLLSAGFFLLLIYSTLLIEINPVHGMGIAMMVALEAAISTLFLVAYADNKVEGLAFSKLLGIMFLGFPAVLLWESSWHWISAWMPSFWIGKAFLHSSQESQLVWADLSLGILLHFGVLVFFLRAFLTRQK